MSWLKWLKPVTLREEWETEFFERGTAKGKCGAHVRLYEQRFWFGLSWKRRVTDATWMYSNLDRNSPVEDFERVTKQMIELTARDYRREQAVSGVGRNYG